MAKITTLKEFESIFPKLAEDILDHAKQYKLPEEFVKWFKAVGTPRIILQHQADENVLSPCMPTRSVENATVECPFQTQSLCSSKLLSPKNNTFKPQH